ncbi:ketoacyl-ACP synthase III family protein [Rhodococcoides kyotonense]|uniref:3-oxoacyl-[acyl-carrier-protein] synthase-3 n=1 Tax=Rhodococcoides kyotonense TaxID=398843 RepID=A0A239MAM4_9NOCA|nr:ketoacyl-ACP synthase III family protein [Rhodococcus kyotonensis]SNT40027.1 3-oxoacyl-[acyl-carrier-protein] synthase-3 [Rhodococcus kyotonensis]
MTSPTSAPELFVAAVSSQIGDLVDIGDAVAAGHCAPALARSTAMQSAATSEDVAPPDLAASAAEKALKHSGIDPESIGLLLHANFTYQGHDIWPAASYVQRRTGARRALALEIRQASNGGMAALQIAANYLGSSSLDHALITTGDRFVQPHFDRWRSDPGTVYGDGGTALILGTEGFAQLIAIHSRSEPELERMHRGDDPFARTSLQYRTPVNLDLLKRQYISRAGSGTTVARVSRGLLDVVAAALDDSGLTIDDVAHVVVPNFGRRRLEAGFLTPLGIPIEKTLWEWTRTVGHLGPGDQIAGLDHLLRTRTVAEGDHCLMLGVGAGFSWTCAILRFTDTCRANGARLDRS